MFEERRKYINRYIDTTFLEKGLKGMKETIKKYEMGIAGKDLIFNVATCPLCQELNSACGICPHKIITDYSCHSSYGKSKYKDIGFHPLWKKLSKEEKAEFYKSRIKELETWIEFYEEIISERRNENKKTE